MISIFISFGILQFPPTSLFWLRSLLSFVTALEVASVRFFPFFVGLATVFGLPALALAASDFFGSVSAPSAVDLSGLELALASAVFSSAAGGSAVFASTAAATSSFFDFSSAWGNDVLGK